MKRTAATILITLSLSAAAAAQTPASKAKPTRAKKASATVASASAADDEVERVFDRYFLASGGLAYAALRTRIMRGTVEISNSPVDASFEAYEKMPRRSLIVITGPGGQFIQASDSGRKWVKSPWGGVMSAPSAGGEDVLSNGGKGGSNGFKWRSHFSSVRLKGRAVVEGRETIVLAATPVGGQPSVMYFDAQTGLLRKQEYVNPGAPKGERPSTVYIDSYATVDGVKVPVLFRYVYPGMTMTFRATVVKHNVAIDDALFKDPNVK